MEQSNITYSDGNIVKQVAGNTDKFEKLKGLFRNAAVGLSGGSIGAAFGMVAFSGTPLSNALITAGVAVLVSGATYLAGSEISKKIANMKYDYLNAAAAMDNEVAEFIGSDDHSAIKEARQNAADNPKVQYMPVFLHT